MLPSRPDCTLTTSAALFQSKDELLPASLERRASAQVAALLPPADDGRSPRARIVHVFEQVQAGAPEFKGCQYLAVHDCVDTAFVSDPGFLDRLPDPACSAAPAAAGSM